MFAMKSVRPAPVTGHVLTQEYSHRDGAIKQEGVSHLMSGYVGTVLYTDVLINIVEENLK